MLRLVMGYSALTKTVREDVRGLGGEIIPYFPLTVQTWEQSVPARQGPACMTLFGARPDR